MAELLITQVQNPNDPTHTSAIASSLETIPTSLSSIPISHSSPHKKWGVFFSIFQCCTSRPKKSIATPLPAGDGKFFLPPLDPSDIGKKCLVLDLDETLIHSSFKPVEEAHYTVPVEIDGQIHTVYVLKRPHVDTFLEKMGAHFECIIYTASLSKYADPVIDILDKNKHIKHRLYREACHYHNGSFVKDLSMLGRDMKTVIILDNAPVSYLFHPSNAIPITSWFDDTEDCELLELIPFLLDLKMEENVMTILDQRTI